MAELTPSERLQPSLLDRLTDDQPGSKVESRAARVMTMAQLRDAVIRDLSWLLNTSSRGSFENIQEFPNVATSVINYGIPDLCGTTTSGLIEGEIERTVRKAIETYEPRVLQRNLRIQLIRGASVRGATVVALEISGEIWGDPAPAQLYIRTEIDLDTGECVVPGGSSGG